ncbi:MAG: hypothetical protein A2Y92_04540 [Chloroflexi bacterium RBG_13_57_8]|nr:MAG: hypothetical protein A2Y92_04540 [Chloroflexi bacterium RBG_13_57_8]
MAHLPGLVDGELDDLLGPRGKASLAAAGLFPPADNEFHRRADLAQSDAQVSQDAGGDALFFADKAE